MRTYRGGMSVVFGIVVVLHLIGWAIALGALLTTMKEPKVSSGVLHGLYLALATGLALTGIAGAQAWDLNYVKIGISSSSRSSWSHWASSGRTGPRR